MKLLQAVHKYPVVIFGASVLGEVALTALEICGVKPVCFGDNNFAKQQMPFHGYEVMGIDEICRKYPDAVMVIGAGRYYEEIYQMLSEREYSLIYNDADTIDSMDFSTVPFEKFEKILWRLAQLGKLACLKNIPPEALHLSRLNVVVTERCTLRCTNCSSLMPQYINPKDCNFEILVKSMEAIMQTVDYIYHMEVLGGEPFLNSELSLILRCLALYKTILQIDVITNGTILPPDELIQALKQDNICVVINDYGAASVKKEEVFSTLTAAGINCRINRHWAWADLGGFENRNRTHDELRSLFQRCNFSTCSELLNGQLHRCPRSSHGMNAGLISNHANDYINVLKDASTIDELRNRIRTLVNMEWISACQFCNGNINETLILKPAIQPK